MNAVTVGFGAQTATTTLQRFVRFVRGSGSLSVADKVYSIAGFLTIVTMFLLVMSVQCVRLQTNYRHMQIDSASAAVNIGRVNALIYAIVMESRGIYMSTEPAKVKQFADELVKCSGELTAVMMRWEQTVHPDDLEQFEAFKQRVMQFIDFRLELVRRGSRSVRPRLVNGAITRPIAPCAASSMLTSRHCSDPTISEPAKPTSLLTRTAMRPGTYSCLDSRRWSLPRSTSSSCATPWSGGSPISRKQPTGSPQETSRARCRI
ncbi:hypothetical protein DI395_45395 [Bradyrhizobium diazoefficiens]|nr:hypothetical protein DI395_45395 [Bradyrhizobium diazoefficiens]